MGPFKGEVPAFARLWPGGVRVRVSFTAGAVRSAILATAGLLVRLYFRRQQRIFAVAAVEVYDLKATDIIFSRRYASHD